MTHAHSQKKLVRCFQGRQEGGVELNHRIYLKVDSILMVFFSVNLFLSFPLY